MLTICETLVRFFASRTDIYAYISCPTPKAKDSPHIPDSYLGHGQNIRLTPLGPDAPSPWDEGEGEVVAHLYVDWLRQFYPPTATYIIVSIDNDSYPIVLARPPAHSENLWIRLRSTTHTSPKRKANQQEPKIMHRRFLNCAYLYKSVDPAAFETPLQRYLIHPIPISPPIGRPSPSISPLPSSYRAQTFAHQSTKRGQLPS